MRHGKEEEEEEDTIRLSFALGMYDAGARLSWEQGKVESAHLEGGVHLSHVRVSVTMRSVHTGAFARAHLQRCASHDGSFRRACPWRCPRINEIRAARRHGGRG